MIFCIYEGEGFLRLLTLLHLFACERVFNILLQRTTLNKNVLKIHQSKRNEIKYKKSLLSSETNIINTELVISLKLKSKHGIIKEDETRFTPLMSWH